MILCIGLFSCSKKEFDAKTYVESFLDAVYHSKYEEYAKALDISEKDAKADIEQDFKQKIQQEFKDFDGIKEEGIEEYEEMMRKVKMLAKYEVVDSKKDDSGDNYIVEVRVEPSDIYQTLEQSSLEVSTKKIEQGMDSEDPEVFASVLTESVEQISSTHIISMRHVSDDMPSAVGNTCRSSENPISWRIPKFMNITPTNSRRNRRPRLL